MKSIKFLLFIAAALSLTVACKDSKGDAAREVPAASTPVSTSQNPPAAPAETVPVGPLTSISYPETEFDFGEIQEGEKIVHEFTFKNTGNEPLVISKAQGSCGCTVPEWPREPIAPGQSNVIRVKYDAKKVGPFSKSVSIESNASSKTLRIKGTVEKELHSSMN